MELRTGGSMPGLSSRFGEMALPTLVPWWHADSSNICNSYTSLTASHMGTEYQ